MFTLAELEQISESFINGNISWTKDKILNSNKKGLAALIYYGLSNDDDRLFTFVLNTIFEA